jgi:hypothetical protein
MDTNELAQATMEVLRAVTVTLALEQKADMGRLASALRTWAKGAGLTPTSRLMLGDLAEGLDILGGK